MSIIFWFFLYGGVWLGGKPRAWEEQQENRGWVWWGCNFLFLYLFLQLCTDFKTVQVHCDVSRKVRSERLNEPKAIIGIQKGGKESGCFQLRKRGAMGPTRAVCLAHAFLFSNKEADEMPIPHFFVLPPSWWKFYTRKIYYFLQG